MTAARPAYIQRLIEPPALDDAPAPDGREVETPTVAGRLEEVPFDIPEAHLDEDAVKVVRRLSEHGHEAYLVGGCVRDLLFGLRPKDFDIATSARPNQVRRLFRNCRIIGRRFRLAHVFFRDKILEVATFRSSQPLSADDDGELLIRDDNVFGTKEEDAFRRDFTVNALLYDVDRKVILDHAGGVADARARVIRSIGDPFVRMQEDPIRILRAIRLAARLDCKIDETTWRALSAHRRKILDAAAPRIQEDLLRMYRGGAVAPAFDRMIESGVLGVVLPELHEHLAAAAQSGDTEEIEAQRSMLRQADRWTHEGRDISTPIKLALLLAPIVLAPDEKSGGAPAERANARMQPITTRLSISRKDAEKVRQVLLAQDKLVPRLDKQGRRRPGSRSLVRRSYFPESLAFFELMTAATGDLRDEAERWRHHFEEAFPDGPPPEPKRAPRRRRRPRPR